MGAKVMSNIDRQTISRPDIPDQTELQHRDIYDASFEVDDNSTSIALNRGGEVLITPNRPVTEDEVQVFDAVEQDPALRIWYPHEPYWVKPAAPVGGWGTVLAVAGLDSLSAEESSSFSMEEALRELQTVREEAEKAYALDNDIDPVPKSAYDDAQVLLKMLSDSNSPMPDIGWAEDGSLGFEWRPKDGIATMGIYGDSLIIYGAFFDNKNQVEGVCALSELTMLKGFLVMLFPSFNKDLI